MLAAQHAPIGAKICTARAIRTIGRNFLSRRRIANPTFPNTANYSCTEQGVEIAVAGDGSQARSWASRLVPSLGMPGHHQTPTVLLAARAIFKAQRRAGN